MSLNGMLNTSRNNCWNGLRFFKTAGAHFGQDRMPQDVPVRADPSQYHICIGAKVLRNEHADTCRRLLPYRRGGRRNLPARPQARWCVGYLFGGVVESGQHGRLKRTTNKPLVICFVLCCSHGCSRSSNQQCRGEQFGGRISPP